MSEGSTRDRGRAVEQHVVEHLQRHGLQVLDRNFEAAGAEVDIVARMPDGDLDLYVFVEVRSRAHDDLGSPVETVDDRKQRQIIKAATAWLVQNDLWNKVAVRFDVIGVTAPQTSTPQIEWIQGAFEARS